ncbi:hypothetical protein D5S19_24090 [Amycolatopsis panacis]|uniref:Uncharacterized protein n=2 Tax=Amycolatopsis panacis TaxID=2340917 RepID=A0A419HVX6_9PSEU|nr:hypothetical protein D5S19_24090 [Amycolatopsis panacis]
MSASGTFQNLGYVLQWPLFGLFPAFMFWRIKKLRAREEAEPAAPAPARPVTVPAPLPEGEDDELAAYNRYLRELHARDQQS